MASGSEMTLITWTHDVCAEYGLNVYDLTSCWGDGKAFCALLHKYLPQGSLNWEDVQKNTAEENLQLAFSLSEGIGVPPLLQVTDFQRGVNSLLVVSFLSLMYKRLVKPRPAEKKFCYTCKQQLRGTPFRALNRNYHFDCFVCSLCNKQIFQQRWREIEGSPYCTACAKILQSSAESLTASGEYENGEETTTTQTESKELEVTSYKAIPGPVAPGPKEYTALRTPAPPLPSSPLPPSPSVPAKDYTSLRAPGPSEELPLPDTERTGPSAPVTPPLTRTKDYIALKKAPPPPPPPSSLSAAADNGNFARSPSPPSDAEASVSTPIQRTKDYIGLKKPPPGPPSLSPTADSAASTLSPSLVSEASASPANESPYELMRSPKRRNSLSHSPPSFGPSYLQAIVAKKEREEAIAAENPYELMLTPKRAQSSAALSASGSVSPAFSPSPSPSPSPSNPSVKKRGGKHNPYDSMLSIESGRSALETAPVTVPTLTPPVSMRTGSYREEDEVRVNVASKDVVDVVSVPVDVETGRDSGNDQEATSEVTPSDTHYQEISATLLRAALRSPPPAPPIPTAAEQVPILPVSNPSPTKELARADTYYHEFSASMRAALQSRPPSPSTPAQNGTTPRPNPKPTEEVTPSDTHYHEFSATMRAVIGSVSPPPIRNGSTRQIQAQNDKQELAVADVHYQQIPRSLSRRPVTVPSPQGQQTAAQTTAPEVDDHYKPIPPSLRKSQRANGTNGPSGTNGKNPEHVRTEVARATTEETESDASYYQAFPKLRRPQNSSPALSVPPSLGSRPSGSAPEINSDEQLLPNKEGWLDKKGEVGLYKGYKRRYFCLRGDKLIYYKDKKDFGEDRVLGLVPLKDAVSIHCSSKNKPTQAFQIDTPDRIWYLEADSVDSMKEWVDAINKHRDHNGVTRTRGATMVTDIHRKEGYLYKLHGRQWRMRYFVLRDGVLCKYNSKEDLSGIEKTPLYHASLDLYGKQDQTPPLPASSKRGTLFSRNKSTAEKRSTQQQQQSSSQPPPTVDIPLSHASSQRNTKDSVDLSSPPDAQSLQLYDTLMSMSNPVNNGTDPNSPSSSPASPATSSTARSAVKEASPSLTHPALSTRELDDTDEECCFRIETPTQTIVLRAASQREMHEWLNELLRHKIHIEETIDSIGES